MKRRKIEGTKGFFQIPTYCSPEGCIIKDVLINYIQPHLVIDLSYIFDKMDIQISKTPILINEIKKEAKKMIIDIVYVVDIDKDIVPMFNSFFMGTRKKVLKDIPSDVVYIPRGTRYLFGELGFMRSIRKNPIFENIKLKTIRRSLRRITLVFGQSEFNENLYDLFIYQNADPNFKLFTQKIQNLFHPLTTNPKLEYLNFSIKFFKFLGIVDLTDERNREGIKKEKAFQNSVDSIVQNINQLSSLKTLSLKLHIETKFEFKPFIQITLKNLKNIKLYSISITKNTITHFENLEILELENCNLNQIFLKMILISQTLKKLKLLYCTFPKNIKTYTLLYGILKIPKLVTLFLGGLNFKLDPKNSPPINITIKTLIIDEIFDGGNQEEIVSSILKVVKGLGVLKYLFLLGVFHYSTSKYSISSFYNLISQSNDISDNVIVTIPFTYRHVPTNIRVPKIIRTNKQIDLLSDSNFRGSDFVSFFVSDPTLWKFTDIIYKMTHLRTLFDLREVLYEM